MADAADAERATGYVVGGISPLGQRKQLPTVVDESVTTWPTVFVSAGRRGLQVEMRAGGARLAHPRHARAHRAAGMTGR